MARTEAPFGPNGQENQQRWTAREAIDMLTQLQGSYVDLIPVLTEALPDHIHCEWQYQPEDLRDAVTVLLRTPRHRLGFPLRPAIQKLYEKYYRKHGIEGNLALPKLYSHNPDLKYNVQISLRGGGASWPAEKVVQTCHMVDFSAQFELQDTIPRMGASLFVNTTRVEGSVYEVDIPTYGVRRELESRERFARYMNQQLSLLNLKNRFDNLRIVDKSQRLVSSLLAARL